MDVCAGACPYQPLLPSRPEQYSLLTATWERTHVVTEASVMFSLVFCEGNTKVLHSCKHPLIPRIKGVLRRSPTHSHIRSWMFLCIHVYIRQRPTTPKVSNGATSRPLTSDLYEGSFCLDPVSHVDLDPPNNGTVETFIRQL